MLWIIIGLGVLTLVGWTIFCIVECEEFEFWGPLALVIFLATILLFGMYCLIIDVIPWKYEEGQKVEEYELVSLRDEVSSVGEGNRRYISIYAENSYTYYLETEVPASYGEGTTYKAYTISGRNVFIMEDDKYIDDAKLVKYVLKPKNRFWSSGIVADKFEYVFYVPEGSIVKNISLN